MVKRHREQGIKFEEFKRLRAAVDAALEPFSTARADLDNVRLQDPSVAKLRKDVASINERVASDYPKLREGLAAMDLSECCSGGDWANAADHIWDAILTAFDKAQNRQRAEEDAKAALAELIGKLGELRAMVTNRLAAEVTRYSQAI